MSSFKKKLCKIFGFPCRFDVFHLYLKIEKYFILEVNLKVYPGKSKKIVNNVNRTRDRQIFLDRITFSLSLSQLSYVDV